MELRYKPEKTPKKWVELQSTKFTDWVTSKFTYEDDPQSGLFVQQRFVRDFIQPGSPYRGVLLYHGLGVGKTAAAIVAAEAFINKGVCVMLPASLRQNFVGEIQKYGNRMFSADQHWTFMEKKDADADLLSSYRLEKPKYKMVKKSGESIKGVWIPDVDTPSNFEKMSVLNQKNIQKQLSDMVDGYYNFLHYNGINKKKVIEMTENNTINPFDNKFVIIDEVHNFISRVVNSRKVALAIYDMLMNANNCKILLLSGTPLINYPHELAAIHNLVRGKLEYHSLSYAQTVFDVNAVREYLNSSVYVDNFSIAKYKININITPIGFCYEDDKKKTLVKTKKDHDTIINDIIKELKKLNVKFKSNFHSTSMLTLLPMEEEEFNSYFIDFETADIRNSNLLSGRIQGLVSYYHAYPEELYPVSLPLNIVKLPMSDHQFLKYGIERDKERKNEMKSRDKYKNQETDNIFKNNGNIYRCFSRSICNFVFPTSIKRPYPSTIGEFKKEMDDADDVQVEEEEDTDMTMTYQTLIERSLKKLREESDEHLTLDALAKYSPKFKFLIEKILECKGTCLVYSQFRTVEGLGVISIAMDANGFQQLEIAKDSKGEWDIDIENIDLDKQRYVLFKSDPEYAQILLNIFNSNFDKLPKMIAKKVESLCANPADRNLHGQIAKVIMITQSGSEGISLKNVRQVHVLEPYWNNIRLNQVIGRAVRANSHIDLPKEERIVESFMYLSTFGDMQGQGTSIEFADLNATSDEYIYNIAVRKSKIIDKLLTIMKNGAIDCQIHKNIHMNTQCHELHPNIKREKDVYNYNITLDVRDNVYTNAKQVLTYEDLKLKIVKFPDGNRFALDKTTGILYDVDKAKNNDMVVVGKIKKIDGQLSYKLLKKNAV